MLVHEKKVFYILTSISSEAQPILYTQKVNNFDN